MPIFINTVKDRIIAIDKNATDQLLLNLKYAKMFSICFDDCTDITSAAHLAAIPRFFSRNKMKQELISLMTIFDKTSGQDIMNEFNQEFIRLVINFRNIVFVTIDRAPSTIENNNKFVKLH